MRARSISDGDIWVVNFMQRLRHARYMYQHSSYSFPPHVYHCTNGFFCAGIYCKGILLLHKFITNNGRGGQRCVLLGSGMCPANWRLHVRASLFHDRASGIFEELCVDDVSKRLACQATLGPKSTSERLPPMGTGIDLPNRDPRSCGCLLRLGQLRSPIGRGYVAV